MTLGLWARAGAFLLLPMLAAWAAWEHRGERRCSVHLLAAGAIANRLGFWLNVLARHAWFIGLNLLGVAGLIRVWRDRHLHLHS